ncbi:MAG: glycosyltransferase family 4 protein [Sphingomonas sp.]|nr:glycosyltransferase family 4 protein [Sphingomonas sp.]
MSIKPRTANVSGFRAEHPPKQVVLFGSLGASLINFRGPLIAAMIERGHKVFALAPAIDSETADSLRALGAEPLSVSLGRTSLNPLEALRTIRELKRIFRRIKPDTVIAYTIKPIGLGATAARAVGIGTFVPLVTGLGYAFTGGREPRRLISRFVGARLYKRAFAHASIAIFQNPDDLADFGRLGLLPRRLRTELISGSGIDLTHFAEVAPPEHPSFLMIARLLKDKGIREFGEAAKRLKQQCPDVRISLVGFIDSSPDTISQVDLDELLRGGIEYLGPLRDVRPAIAAHSVYVLPSYREGTPRSVLEAMAVGRAIITTDAPGCRETVADGRNGLLVPPRDADALFEAMSRLCCDMPLVHAMGRASRRLASEKFDVHKVNAAILDYAGL